MNSWTNIVYVSFFNVKIWYIISHIIGKKDKVNTSMEFEYQPKFSGKQLLRKLIYKYPNQMPDKRFIHNIISPFVNLDSAQQL